MMKRFLLPLVLAFGSPAQAESLALKDGSHWVTVASSKDQDTAIGIARLYGASASVVSSQSGWFGVVLGPVKAPSLAAFKSSWEGWPEIPNDAVFSLGNKFTARLWRPDVPPESVELTAEDPQTLIQDGLSVSARLVRSGDNQAVRITGRKADGASFDLETPADSYIESGATLRLARLDPGAQSPTAIVTQHTGGAHCCLMTWFVSETAPGHWQLLDSKPLDGDGYWLEDVDGDGVHELMSLDNSFLYAFDSYAGSFAPVVISQVRGEEIDEFAPNAAWRARLRQDLGGMEFAAKLSPDIWNTNGYLAAWVAIKASLGEGAEAWARMLKSYQKSSDFGPERCVTGAALENCPEDSREPVPFPEALHAFLQDAGYGPLPPLE